MAEQTTLKRTPLRDVHVALGAKVVPLRGQEMPGQFPGGMRADHRAVRESCGVFDVSHMGEFWINGKRAVDFVNYVTTNDVAALAAGQAHYSTILNDRGTIEDDCLVYRFEHRVMMVVNASNAPKDYAHIARHASRFGVDVHDATDDMTLLAVQGPATAPILQTLTATDLSAIKYSNFAEGEVAGRRAIISRTGYTGEDGFELYIDNESAVPIWEALMATGQVVPAGLGARDTLRLEMGMALYGNDIDDTVTPLEANLAWLVKLPKGDFVGSDALKRQKAEGLKKRLVGFTMTDRQIPRHGYPIYYEGQPSGIVCSGAMSPSLGIAIGTAYLPMAAAKEGTAFESEVPGQRLPPPLTPAPFFNNPSHPQDTPAEARCSQPP